MKRGNLLWTGSRMMLAEHRQLLNERLTNLAYDAEVKHSFDEQQLEYWEEICAKTIINNSEIVIILKNNKILKQVTGKIVNWSLEQGYFYIDTNEGERVRILMSEIADLLCDSN